MDIKLFITGAAGQVGHELVDLCAAQQINYTAYTSQQLDITNEQTVMAEVSKQQPTHIINAAAYTAVDKAEEEKEKAFAVNADGPKYLAQAAKAIGAKLLHISTDYVFDGEKTQPYTVEDTPNPTSVYGASKLAGEQAIEEVFQATIDLGGTLSGEHGIGLAKAPYMSMAFSDEEMNLFQTIKNAFDPNNILNPTKMGLK